MTAPRILLNMVIIALVASACSATPTPTIAPQTQFTISPRLQNFYEAKGGLQTFGLPISEERTENGITFQYFDNARIEFNPNLPEGQRVRLSNIALEDQQYNLGMGEPCIKPISVQPNAYFFQNCHSVPPEFQSYFNELGGLEFFGYPISERRIEGAMFVQYFERAAIVWRSGTSKFELGRVGYLIKTKTPLSSAKPITFTVQAHAVYPLLVKGQAQILTAVVKDYMQKPIAGAKVTFTLSMPSLGTVTYEAPNTNSNGISSFTLPSSEIKTQGIVTFYVTAAYQSGGIISTVTHTGQFLPWQSRP